MAKIEENLSEEEACLFAILSDVSGIDQAEFSFHDASEDARDTDGCFRARSYQWSWFRCTDGLQICQMGRGVGKTLSVILRAFAFPFLFPAEEMVITAPELNHLERLTQLVENRYWNTRLGREMMVTKRGGVTHRPFAMKFENQSQILGRIPQKDGRGILGVHPMWLELDEASLYPTAGWTELIETLKRGSKGAVWRALGVTRGLRDHFYKFTTDPNSKWTIHRMTAMARDDWTDEERQEKIEQYGSKNDPDYRRNVLGEHGDATSPLFDLGRLMRCVCDELEHPYNTEEYYHLRITPELIIDMGGLDPVLILPTSHTSIYKTFWVGADIGWTRDPTEILVFAEYSPNKEELAPAKRLKKAIPMEGTSRLKLVTRIQVIRGAVHEQSEIFRRVIDHYKPKAFSMDATGAGLPLFQLLQKEAPEVLRYIKGYNFSEKITVDFDQRRILSEEEADQLDDDAKIEARVLEFSTDKLRETVDHQRLWLPWDRELLGEFQGQIVELTKGNIDQYGRRRFTGGSGHCLDAARMCVLGWKQFALEEMLTQPSESVLDLPVYM